MVDTYLAQEKLLYIWFPPNESGAKKAQGYSPDVNHREQNSLEIGCRYQSLVYAPSIMSGNTYICQTSHRRF